MAAEIDLCLYLESSRGLLKHTLPAELQLCNALQVLRMSMMVHLHTTISILVLACEHASALGLGEGGGGGGDRGHTMQFLS